MARRLQAQLAWCFSDPVRRFIVGEPFVWKGRVEVGGEIGLGEGEVDLPHGGGRLADRAGFLADGCTEATEDLFHLLLFARARLAPGVAKLHRADRLDEKRGAAGGDAVHDAGEIALGVRFDRHDVAAVALRHDRLLGQATGYGLPQQSLYAIVQTGVRDLDGAAPLGEFGAGAIQDLAARPDRAIKSINEGGEIADPLGDRRERGNAVTERDHVVAGMPGGAGEAEHVKEFGGREPPAAGRRLDEKRGVPGRVDGEAWLDSPQALALGCQPLPAQHFFAVVAGRERARQRAAGFQGAVICQPVADLGEFERFERLGVQRLLLSERG